MKKAAITAAGQPLSITTDPVPDTPLKGLLLKVLASGVCHTDLHLITDEISLGNGKVFRCRDQQGKLWGICEYFLGIL